MSRVLKAIVGPISGFALFGKEGLTAGVINAVTAFVGGPLAAGLRIAGAIFSGGLKQRQAAATTVQVGEVPRAGLMGEAATAGSLVDAFNFGGKYGTDWTVLVLALADHRCDALVGMYVTDTYVPYTADGVVPGYKDQLQVYWRPGTWDQSPPAFLTVNAPPYPAGHPQAGQPTWTANDRGRGVSYVVVAYKADKSDAKNPVWSNGRPQFLWVMRGMLCYSARDDSSVGGDGPHRWDDPATRAWSDNLYDCRYTWERGLYAGDRVDEPAMLLLGRGLTAAEAPPQNVFAPANLCDEPVALKAGGTEPRYTANGVWSADQPWIDVEQMFASACGGVIVEREGAVEIEPGQAKAAVWTITDDDLLVGTQVTARDLPVRTDSEWVNTVTPRYVEPSQKFKDHGAPVRRIDADIIADAGPRESAPSLALVTSGTQAQRVGEMVRRLGRLWKRRTLTLGPRFAGAEHGDWLLWISARYGGSVLFRIESDALGQDWRNALSLRQVSATFADWTAAIDEGDDGSVVVNPGVPGEVGAPGPGAWSLAIEAGSSAALVITGAADDDYASSIVFEFASGSVPDPEDDGDWTIITVGGQTATRAELGGIAADTNYYAAVSYIIGGERGDRLMLGPVSYSSAALAPAPATLLTANGGAGSATIGWRNPSSSNFGNCRVYRGTTTVFADATEIAGPIVGGLGQVMSLTDTVTAGTYWYWVRSFSGSGVASTSPTGPETATVA